MSRSFFFLFFLAEEDIVENLLGDTWKRNRFIRRENGFELYEKNERCNIPSVLWNGFYIIFAIWWDECRNIITIVYSASHSSRLCFRYCELDIFLLPVL